MLAYLKFPILLLTALCCYNTSIAQTTNLQGAVTDQSNGTAIDYASVALIHLPDSAKTALNMTNEKGKFSFEQVKPGNYVIKVLAIGYHLSTTAPFEVKGAALTLPTIQLKANVKMLNEVNIVSKPQIIKQQADRTVVDVEQMNTAGDNALEVIKRAPGIHLDKDENIVFKGKTGVNVMIDGKMSYMSGSELTTYLKSLPASVVSKLELMSNPPSSFDAAGSAGIIDIKLKRNKIQGFNGNANINAGYGEYGKASSGINMNYNIGKISSYARYSYNYSNSFNRLTLKRNINGEQFNQNNFWHPITKSSNYAAGTDYFINDRHTVGVLWKGYTAPYTTNSESNSISYNINNVKTGSVNSKNPQDNTSGNNAFNLNYRFKIDTLGRTLSFDADHVSYNNSRTEQYINSYYDASEVLIGNTINLRNKGFGDVSIYAIKADYVHPFSKRFKAETGFKSSWVTSTSDVRFDSLKNDNWINDAKRTNRFSYRENINAAYLSLSGSFKNLELKAGLRAEQTHGEGSSSGTNEDIDRNYWQLFPTAFASWKISANHQLQASYSRRINRPSYTSMNPFAFYSDPYTAIKGNPLLLPAFSNNVELNYTYKNFRVLSLTYSNTNGDIFPVIYQNDQTKESISIEENLGNTKSLYAATGSSFDITEWWNNNNELAASYTRIKTDVQASDYNTKRFSWEFNTDNTFSLPKNYKINLSGFYSSPSVNGLFRSLANYGISVGAKKTLMNDKATISLKVNDVFNTQSFRANLKYNNVNTYWKNQWESRRVNLSFSYKFGNMKIKTARTRNTGTTDEENRVNN